MDHRCGTRFTLSLAVELQTEGHPCIAGRLVAASVTGGLVESRLRLQPLTPVMVLPPGAAGTELEVEAYVVRTTDKGMALEWLDPACDAVLALLPQRATGRSAASAAAQGPAQLGHTA